MSTSTRYTQPDTVAVIIDPDGGEHGCYDVTDKRHDIASRFWSAGMVGRSVEELADRLWAGWDKPCESAREFDELCAAEARIP